MKVHYPINPITSVDKLLDALGQMMLTAKVSVPNLERTGSNTLIGFDRTQFRTALSELELTEIVSAVSKPGDIETIAVNTENKTVAYASFDNYIGIPLDRVGIDEATLQDKHFKR